MRQDEYCAEVYRVIRENFRANDVSGGMTAAAAAYVVQQALSVSHEAFGFERFKDVLAFIEKQGLIRTGPNAKQAFALWLTESPATPTAALRVGNRPPPPFRRLRNPIWLAFVATSPGGRRFLNRVTGDVKVGLAEPPDTSSEWAEVHPIDDAKEREEASEFLVQRGLEQVPGVKEALASDRWFTELPAAIAKVDPLAANEWKRIRSSRVTSQAEDWCVANNVSGNLVFEEPQVLAGQAARRQPNELRHLLLSAIQRMSTDQLLDTQIPARFLIAALKPELLEN